MMRSLLVLPLITLAACNSAATTNGQDGGMDSASSGGPLTRGAEVSLADAPFTVEEMGNYEEPWAADFMPGTNLLFITGKKGQVWFKDVATGRTGSIESGLPRVDYGGQGGLGDIAFGPDWEDGQTSGGTLYLSFAEAGDGDTRGAAVGRGTLICEEADSCRLEGFEVLWRQDKTTGRGHYSHRIHFSPDGEHMFVTAGDRQKLTPAQETDNTIGKVLRMTLDGQPAAGNPWADQGGAAAYFWSIGHRNLLGLDFAPDGRLWEIEMGPAHGDELNLIEPGKNYGWPVRSYGDHYDGREITDHSPDDGFEKPKVYWDPATSPASLLIYSGDLFGAWTGDALVPGLSGQELNHIDIEGDTAVAITHYPMGARLREVVQGPDGAIYVLEDDRRGSDGTLLRLTPKG
ncbi:PQQ-dependent sugar dehydrogenase [Sphingomicrobium marinum]|uniref:PQQ-dependent sugar dehydrogenase n=1 Tax=Sphingomicrobium marinum TaxID=1227950 RepID=UPI00223FF526|nr:PQQ-dependent sugar dehydrogenase [Sphingomicrobium marinum]